jgi:ADP-ribose pyrophosphatase YjhB (NUDIX family)
VTAGSQAPRWLVWARELQSVAQAGIAYSDNPYDIERYEQVRRVAAELAAARAGGDPDAIAGLFSLETGYPTPKIDVRAAVIHGGRILLVRELDDGGWSMPGGWADVGESAAEAAVRETREEAGVDVRAVKLIALLDRERNGHPPHPQYSYKAFFLCEVEDDPSPRAGSETSGAAFFDPQELPPLSLARTMPAQIALACAHHDALGLPTAFD